MTSFTATDSTGRVWVRNSTSANYSFAVVGECRETFHGTRAAAEKRAAKVVADFARFGHGERRVEIVATVATEK